MRPLLRALLALVLLPLASAAPSALLDPPGQLEAEGAALDAPAATLRSYHVAFVEAPDPTWPVEGALCGDLRAGASELRVEDGQGRGFFGYGCLFPHPDGALLRDMYSTKPEDAHVWAVVPIITGVEQPCADGWTTFDGVVGVLGTVLGDDGVDLRGAYRGPFPCSLVG